MQIILDILSILVGLFLLFGVAIIIWLLYVLKKGGLP